MPELPEVETVRRGLERRVVGRHVGAVEVGRERTVRRTSPEAVVHGLTDTTILAANRRGKYLLLPLDSGDELMIHLRMSGQVLVAPTGNDRPPHTHVVLHLDGDADRPAEELWFVDPRTFGEVVVFDPDNVAVEIPDLAALGPDPIAEGLALPQLRAILRSHRRQLKPLLLDQHVIAGIGNIYADEILHEARLRPDRISDELSTMSERRLHDAIHRVLSEAIASGGSTLGDAQYVDLFGEGGSYQDEHHVYGREGERCRTCGVGWIRRTVSVQRSTFYCPRCQR
ncbi:MAG: bifunctional DNA-formamidopyrimidine glycosylase/DNA-(apurinic or apyrimidinic site) lyase [Ilumatobacter sp.]|uniref:bifunctional DNA-formamidopyrimidine glycosylase/DNA-(apurinic or apyrimidinic site) lyase n=1 Tax=Ilumatobacter sp. TaxID=1967498 RepID=UPI00262AB3DC|nr:bifunctional DNA-formamidopyrimidine glycosylase/DNA-(apurinic or apyrimidinic site) lyase [Ilumatobacter sp.]MDJ0768269.1 bifunctional DNA-formamidopyrimidine glycosylase/DNA-(apurinic or apyrimidinic site) lyase [Ilumatobacter sp.]